MAASEHPAGEVVGGPGWAIQRVGPWVLGHWNESLNEQRVLECRKLYREARKAHGRFQVLAVFRGYPFDLDLLRGARARQVAISMFEENADSVDALIFPLEGTGIKGAIMRTAAASVVHPLRRRVPIHFPSTLEDGIGTARELHLFDARVSEARVRELMGQLEARARW